MVTTGKRIYIECKKFSFIGELFNPCGEHYNSLKLQEIKD
jgi:hypothetical protein